MLTSLVISALTCIAMNWLELHPAYPFPHQPKEATHETSKAEPWPVAPRVHQDGAPEEREELSRDADARRHPAVGG